MKNTEQRQNFGSSIGVIAAAAGSAIGLGNIWKFPYITGKYGGSAFILFYLLCIALIGIPVMLSEFTIGRRAKKNPIGAFKSLKQGTKWFLGGWIGLISAIVVLGFYSVVAGWTMDYLFKSVFNVFNNANSDQIGLIFGTMLSNPFESIFWQMIFMILTALIVLGGIKDGIEKYSKLLMPLLFVLVIILDIRAITLPGASEGIKFLMEPDFTKLTPQAMLAAMGHAFFSLSLGMGTMITYGSYMNKDEKLFSTALKVSFADTLIAIMAGFAIFPAVFAFGIEPSAGPPLVFLTLPHVFSLMSGGYIFSILFFFLLFVAALTSSISILEVVVTYIAEEKNITRNKAIIISSLFITAFGSIISLGNNILSEYTFVFPNLNRMNIFDWFITLSDQLLPLGGLIIALFVGWVMDKDMIKDEINFKNSIYYNVFIFIVKYLAPLGITLTLLNGLGLL
jgi:NSS family neurotransmitter:Na+ symporter